MAHTNDAFLVETVALGAITGMRSMAGPATLAFRRESASRSSVALMAAAEMIVDKTSFVGDRTDPLPLVARALMGALVGGVIAREHDRDLLLGGVIGASASVIAAHLAYRARKRLPLTGVWSGLLEDSVVVGIAAFLGSRSPASAIPATVSEVVDGLEPSGGLTGAFRDHER
jgi:uncharacterized membrane protein